VYVELQSSRRRDRRGIPEAKICRLREDMRVLIEDPKTVMSTPRMVQCRARAQHASP